MKLSEVHMILSCDAVVMSKAAEAVVMTTDNDFYDDVAPSITTMRPPPIVQSRSSDSC